MKLNFNCNEYKGKEKGGLVRACQCHRKRRQRNLQREFKRFVQDNKSK